MDTVLKLEKTKFKIEVFGEICELRKPNWSEIEKYQADIRANESNDKGSLSLTRNLLVALGIKDEHVSQLEIEHVSALMDLIIPKKKD